MELCRIIIPVDVNEANPNRFRSLRQKMRVKRDHIDAAKLCWVKAGRPMSEVKVRVSVIIRRARKLDPDNAIASLKHLIDGIFKDAITKDDSDKYIELGIVSQETNAKYKSSPEVEFVVECI